MNAYKAYKKRQAESERTKVIMENVDAYIEHMDLIMLSVLHTEFGFGASRLKRVYCALGKRFDEYRFYIGDTDKTCFNDDKERMDTWKLKEDLREIGFDYDEVVRELLNEGQQE